MKVVLINGSPHRKGNTFIALSEVAGALEKEGVQTEIIQLGIKAVQGCIACNKCAELGHCVFQDTLYNQVREALQEADVLADGAKTVAYSYIGPELTYQIYYDGSIGQAKQDLYRTADKINEHIQGTEAYVAVNKAVVTQPSSAIPIVPLYISILFKVMKELNLHEGCIEQMYRLVHDRLCVEGGVPTDENHLIRMDDYEMKPEVQEEVKKIWEKISPENLSELTDIDGYWQEFYEIFGFRIEGVDYDADVNIQTSIPSIISAE